MKYYLKLLSLPLGWLVTIISLFVVWNIFDLPRAEVLIRYIGVWFNTYGLVVLLAGAFIEGILLLGSYFPGVFVIFAGVVSAHSLSEAMLRIGIGTIGLILAHSTNYTLGKYGWYKLLTKFGLRSSIEEAQGKLLKHGPLAIFTSYWLPSMSALTDTAAGILHMPFKKFISYSVSAVIFWDLLVGLIVYFLGEKALVAVTSGGTTELLIQFAVVAIWIFILLIFDFHKNKTSPH